MIPLYRNTKKKSELQNEFDIWQKSQAENICCKQKIEKSIAVHFKDNHLDITGAKEIIAEFGYDRTLWVLAASAVNKNHDGRISHENKDWAKKIIPDYLPKEEICGYAVDSHPVLLDGFINQVHREYAALGLADMIQ